MSRFKLSRVELIVRTAVMGIALAGCSAMPNWMTPEPSSQTQPLRFESDPPGADVRTTQGQTCLTPCALPVTSEAQSVTITKIGFVPQTVQVSVGEVPEHSFWEAAPAPTLVPNPVQVVLQPVAPPRPVHKPRPPHPTVAHTRPPASPTPQDAAAPPPQVQPSPPPQQGGSPFPPPPPTR